MTESKPASRRKQTDVSPWRNASIDIDALSEQHRLAHDIVVGRRDLTPSVERIMATDLSDSARTRALTAFQHALTNPGDPNRDPRVAITNARA